MNFLCLGTAFLLFQMDPGSWINYSVKLAGCVLYFIGLNELSELCVIQHKNAGLRRGEAEPVPISDSLRIGELMTKAPEDLPGLRLTVTELLKKLDIAAAAVCGAGAVWTMTVKFAGIKSIAAQLPAMAAGFGSALMCLWLFYSTVSFIYANDCGRNAGDESILKAAERDAEKRRKLLMTFDPSLVNRLRSHVKRIGICMGAYLCCMALNRAVPAESAQTFFGFMTLISGLTFYGLLISAVSAFNKVRVSCNRKYDMDNPISDVDGV
ncbi:MAG: hypothetical protein IJ806_10275 [Ruminococcus sp.]|nr:hypothetical protein [Ruminococcus sp.]